VNVPGVAGADGADGAAGADGVNAYTTTTADFDVPTVGGTVPVNVVNSSWMVVGQPIFVEGPANFVVDSVPTTTSCVLEFKGHEDDLSPGSTISWPAGVSPGGTQPAAITASQLTDYQNETLRANCHTFSETPEALQFNAVNQSLVINATGKWLLLAKVRVDYSWATYSEDNKILNLKLRRTNNSAADIADTTVAIKLRDVSTAYFTAQVVDLPQVVYNTTNTTDALSIYGWLDSGDLPDNAASDLPTGNGRVIALESSLVAIKVAEAS
jgi:hypothetical protein